MTLSLATPRRADDNLMINEKGRYAPPLLLRAGRELEDDASVTLGEGRVDLGKRLDLVIPKGAHCAPHEIRLRMVGPL